VLVDRWYFNPLSDTDGHAPLEIEQVARQLGVSLPAALSEWFELVGQRLRFVQDSPRLLRELSVEDDRLRVWTENQGVWSIFAPLDAGDDPVCVIRGDTNGSHNESLSRMLLGMLVSDTLVGGWSGSSQFGSLGELRSTVRSGYCDDFIDARERLRSRYRELDYAPNPFFEEAYRGDDATLVRFHSDVAIEWMTLNDDAFAALDAVLDLNPPGGEHEVVVAFAAPTPAQLHYLTREDRISVHSPNVDLFKHPLAGVGHVGSAIGGDSPRFYIRTKEPQRVLAAILATVPTDLLPKLIVASRPAAISRFEVLYPEQDSRDAFRKVVIH
jgi:hypothetical protein